MKILSGFFILLATVAFPGNRLYSITPTQKEIRFTAHHNFKSVNGSCGRIETENIKIAYQNKRLTLQSPFAIKVAAASMSTGNSSRDSHMLEVLGYPGFKDITAVILSIKNDADNNEVISGKLTIHGIEKPFTSKAIVSANEASFSLKGHFPVLLSDYNIEAPDLLFIRVKDEVMIEYNFTFSRKE